MNLVLLFPDDFVGDGIAVVRGRRAEHIAAVHRAKEGETLRAGVVNGGIGAAVVRRVDPGGIELAVALERDPPAPLPLTLVVALPRPKVLNRVIASATSLGVKHIVLANAWRVEKSYWKSPRLAPENLLHQSILGLEQAGDTVLPTIETARFFRSLAESRLPEIAGESIRLVAHPPASEPVPRSVREPVTLIIGPEGGFIDAELASLERAGFTPVSLGPRVLRTETAIATVVGRLF